MDPRELPTVVKSSFVGAGTYPAFSYPRFSRHQNMDEQESSDNNVNRPLGMTAEEYNEAMELLNDALGG